MRLAVGEYGRVSIRHWRYCAWEKRNVKNTAVLLTENEITRLPLFRPRRLFLRGGPGGPGGPGRPSHVHTLI